MQAQPSTSMEVSVDPHTTQMNQFMSYIKTLGNPECKDVLKLKAIQEISKNFEMILNSTHYPTFLKLSVKVFLSILEEGEPYFIAEYNIQQVRKLILEILYRLPTNDHLKPYVKPILLLMLKLLEIDNEENVLVCLKIIIELHKIYKPALSSGIQRFLQFVKSIYSNLPNHMPKIFEPKSQIKVKDLSDVNIDELLKETFTITGIQTEKRNKDGTLIAYYLIPKAVLSLKVLQELPIIVVLMYQLYKQDVHQDVSDFIPLIMKTITLHPALEQRQMDTFNKEIFVDFMGAQIKTLSFLAYIIKSYLDVVKKHSDMMVQGMLGLLTLCPMEVAHLRRELLIAARHILATELRIKFVPHMERLFDEDVLLGRGWTTHESLRPLAYSTLADLVHHVRQHLPLTDLIRAVHLFSKNVHDDSLATTIQTMSCKLLLNLADCIRHRSENENSQEGRELLMRMLEVFVLKFKSISKIQLPILIARSEQRKAEMSQSQTNSVSQQPILSTQSGTDVKTEPTESLDSLSGSQPAEKETKSRFGAPQPINFNVSDYRSLVKTLVCGVKTITWVASSRKTDSSQSLSQVRNFQPHETLIFVRLVKWALKALDIYTLSIGPQPGVPLPKILQTVKSKEEKEVLEHFSGVFSMMNAQTFHDIFSTTIEYLVERVHKNSTLQTVPNTLLANPATSPIFATVLVEYLLERMEEMGSNLDRSQLYLKLFKLVFGSVSLFPQENENMLRPHLHQIVNRSMELAMTAAKPHNYFLLLRALFRSIGGGSHDLLYQEFLPLLPNLLEGLNRLQSGLHKQDMKDLFVELCLTVPVRLSSLLPYLPMLMDPLVSALNGCHTLISQGLRTLELCVDNLQHDFLYEHIQPVRAELMQALWRTLRNNDQVAQVAFKVLGKFGGGNRKMMIEPQKLEYVSSDFDPPAILARFDDYQQAVQFPVAKVMDTAFNALKQSVTDPFYRKQAWEVINCYLTASRDLSDSKHTLINLFLHPSFEDPSTIRNIKGSNFKSIHKLARDTHQMALTGMIIGAAIKELRKPAMQTFVLLVRHYTMVAVAQQCGAFAYTPEPNKQIDLDPLVLVDALAVIIGHEERELCKPGHLGMMLIVDTATILLGSKEMACRLPLIEYLSEKMCGLCYERAWYAKLGGCIAIKFMFEKCALKWVYEHMFTFLKALLFVMMDLTGEVSSGALDMARENLQKMLIVLVTPPPIGSDDETMNLQADALHKVTHELVRQVTSPHTMVREQAMASLRLLSKEQNKTVTEVMEPFKCVLADMVPPKNHLLMHQPAIAQMGLMDGNMFCTTLQPRLFTIDLKIHEHNLFITDLLALCKMDDSKLATYFCYKSITNFVPLRQSALRCLAACHYLEEVRDQIFEVLYKALEKPNAELQETAFECMKTFIAGYPIDKELFNPTVRPLLMTLGDEKVVTLNGFKMLSYLTQLFPNEFNELLCEQLYLILEKLLEKLVAAHKANLESGISNNGLPKKSENEQKVVTIVGIFHQTPAASSKFVMKLSQKVLQAEQIMANEASSPFRGVLMKFLLRYPGETLTGFLDDNYIKDKQFSRYLEYLIKHKDGKPFRDYIQNHMINRLIILVQSNYVSINLGLQDRNDNQKNEFQYQGIRIISLLIKYDDQWLSTQQDLVEALKQIWCDDNYQYKGLHFQERHKNVEFLEYVHWKEPKLLVKILLHYFCHYPNDIDLLFQLLRATTDRFIPEFQFLRDFLENTVAQNYTVEWKRSAFFRFVELFQTNEMSQELKAKVLQLILIPCFAVSFERGETNKLIGGPPMPYQDNSENVVSVFINKLIDPDSPYPQADCVRISLLQFSCLLVEQASPHIHDHDANNKAQGFKLRRLMTFAWPCLLVENCVDPATRYHGHLLLSHIIDKFAIHRKIVLQVFHSLLKAHAVEARNVVRQALEILTPSMPFRMEKGYDMLTHWTKKILMDEGHSMQQLYHILQLVVKHYKVYYPVRHDLVQHMVSSIQRLGFSATATLEHRKLAVELAEVIIKWELNGIKEDNGSEPQYIDGRRPMTDESEQTRKKMAVASSTGQPMPVAVKSAEPAAQEHIDKRHTDNVLNFLLRLACQVNEMAPQNSVNPGANSPGELLSRRCVILLKNALKPELWQEPVDLNLGFFHKILSSLGMATPNISNICTALELLTFLLTVMKKEQILVQFKLLQDGLTLCVISSDEKIIQLTHNLLTKLFSIFPLERVNKIQELNLLYSKINDEILNGLNTYDESKSPIGLFRTVMILKAVCTTRPSYIDTMISPFMRVLHRLAKEHLQPTSQEFSSRTVDVLILSLDLVKNRIEPMGVDMRKTFIGAILVGLMEKTAEAKVMRAITRMLEEWMKCKNQSMINQVPSSREKSILLVKLTQYVEKRFPNDNELNAQFLELVNYVYTDEHLKTTELTSKLEPAFLAGLRCNQPHIRAKFFKVFDESMKRRLYDRLLYIVCSQNWEAIGQHYWIKQAIELLLVTATPTLGIEMAHESSILPSITSVIKQEKRNEFQKTNPENAKFYDCTEIKEEVIDMDLSNVESTQPEEKPVSRAENITKMINKHFEYIEISRNITTEQFLLAAAQLCHIDTALAEQVWLSIFPQLWRVLEEEERQILAQEMVPFITSGTHIIQKDCQPSALNTFIEALFRCNPQIQLAPPTMKYIGKNHNLWHRMALTMEQQAFSAAAKNANPASCYEFEGEQNELLDSLADLYQQMCEEDLWAGLWQKHAHYKETGMAIAYEQHGFFEQAQGAYEAAMAKHKSDASLGPVPASYQREILLWSDHWIRCAKELQMWDILTEYAKTGINDPLLLLESCWRTSKPNWESMKEALSNVEFCCPKEIAWKVTLYGGFLLICQPEESKPYFERYVDTATALCLNEWRRLPHIVSHIHLQYLQAAQQIMELQEAHQIHKGLLQGGHQSSLHDMKAIVKTWRNRLPVIADDLVHWSDIFSWRQHHYQVIVKHYEQNKDNTANSKLGMHASAQSIIHFGKIARKHKLANVCLDSLNKIYSISSVPVVDCFQKVRQQVKCYLQMASLNNNKSELQEGLEVINHTKMQYFGKDMTAEFYALKGMMLHLSGKSDEANKAFSAAIQMHDTSVKAWALYGDYLESVFIKDPRQISLGVNAMACFLHACRHQNEAKARKYIAKVLWLLSYDDEKNSLIEALDKYAVGVPPILWLPWTPQLLNCLVQYKGNVILNLLCQAGRMFPQAVYFPVRLLYLTFRTATARKTNTVQQQTHGQDSQKAEAAQEGGASSQTSDMVEAASFKAPPGMVHCVKIMNMLRGIHTTVLSSLEGIAVQMEWFRENWYEEVLRQLRQGLTKCYAIAFENRESVNEAKITPHILNFVKKLMSTFGIGVENISSSVKTATFNSAASESLARRAEATYQDPVFKEMKEEFKKDFDFSQSNSMRLHTLIFKLKKWIKILDNRSKMMLQSFLIEEKCRFLSNFTLKTAEVELPGEFLLPKHNHYFVRISRFMPRVDVVQKHNAAARRLYIRGHNGKIYPYLVVNGSGLADARREERVLQMLRMMNMFLGKQKETSRRFLHFTVPRVVAVSQQIRLVEDNPASISYLDVFKKRCAKLGKQGIEHDDPIQYYYERLASVQSKGVKASHQIYRDIFKSVQDKMVPRTVLKSWATETFPSATDYWHFRKIFTLQLALACFAEYVFHLTRLNPDMMYLHQDSGLMNISYFKFDVDDGTGELDQTRPVPFRLTPNIIEYLASIGITGPLTASIIATARCFVYPNFKVLSILKPILRDEMVLSKVTKKSEDVNVNTQEKMSEAEQIINMVNKAINSISSRLNSLAQFDGTDSKVATLVTAASSWDNLCRMDPAWHPWL
ncbi:transcription-associated protein 1 isoform X2 [Anthonomus grandis grandis]|uniref:transcription-associated protein 1 isoform X2 n=1 Tax=Anthonomus grandis grandis TaxID=2921223 RepID=UPI002166330F|nr:transcription-associated protein 1 isoform X2 [Anthonomus grandis grandis]